LQVELTEAVAETDLRLIHDVLIQLKRLRISAILDDFGTGSSSLSGLRKLPLEGLKIDRSLIDKMPVDRETYETIDLIVTLAGKLKLHAIAEGIETRKQWEMLRELGCEMGQGFFFSPAVDAEAAAKLLAEWSAAGKAKATGR
jgi:EAL domain-containing protein (putative c-di-GMP-specific phosphodiesterase class I)